MVETPKGPRDRKEQPGSGNRPPRGGSTGGTRQVVATLDAMTHDVIKLEWLDQSGQRRALSSDEWANMTGNDEIDDLVATVEEAYAAGVADALGEQNYQEEDDDDRFLVDLLVEQPAGRFLRQGMRMMLLRRLLLRHILRRRSASAAAVGAADQRRKPPIAKHARNGSSSTHHPYQGAH